MGGLLGTLRFLHRGLFPSLAASSSSSSLAASSPLPSAAASCWAPARWGFGRRVSDINLDTAVRATGGSGATVMHFSIILLWDTYGLSARWSQVHGFQ